MRVERIGLILNFKPKDMKMTEAEILERDTLESKLDSGEALTEREHMLCVYSDFHKDAYGIRPRGINVFAMTTEELSADFATFSKVCDENAKAEAIAEARAVEVFKANVANTIAIGAGDEATALRWLSEAAVEKYGWDWEHYLWNAGILHTEYGKAIGKRIAPIFGSIYAAGMVA